MEIVLKFLSSLDDALDLAPEIDRYARETLAEFRDDPPPAGTGDRLLRRVLEAPEGLVATAALAGSDERVGWCIVGPFVDPLVGDALPMVVGLWVQPELRHRGLARKLVSAARDELARRGHGTLAARAGHNDDALISMGERWGFTRTWEIMGYEGGG